MGLLTKKKPNAAVNNEELVELRGQIAALNRSQAVIEFEIDGTIVNANDNFLNAVGYSLQEIQGQHHRMFCESSYADSPQYQELWTRLRNGDFVAGEFKRLGKGGREIWIQASYNPVFGDDGTLSRVVKFATDITESKNRNARYKGQVEAINRSQAVIEFKPDGTIVTANENFLSTVGYSLDEIRGKHHRMFVEPAEANSPSYADFWQTLQAGQYQAAQYKRLGKGGVEIWIQASYNPVTDPDGRVIGVIKFATNITEQVLAQREAEEARNTVEVGNSIATSVGEISTAVQEISRSVTRTAELARNATDSAEATSREVAGLKDASNKIGKVVDVIQDLAEQTNLLALNATIEAARAGESGKGFAVVAQEVKGLAHQTGSATQDISGTIAEIQASIDDVIKSVETIGGSIKEVDQNTSTVAAAVEEQSVMMGVLRESASALQK